MTELLFVLALLAVVVIFVAGIVAIRSGELSGRRVAVLIYHRVLDREAPMREQDREDWGCTVFADESRDHLDALTRAGFTAISPADYLEYLRGSKDLPERPVLITFDDGWRSVYEYALPALLDAGMPATVFVNTVADNANFAGGAPLDGAMTPRMIAECHAAGITIGSHGATHTYLTLLDDDALRRELSESKRDLEAIVGAPVNTLAAPGGQANAHVAELARAAGYELFFAGGSGTIGRGNDPMNLPRLGVERGTSGSTLVAGLRPAAILQHRAIQAAKRLPTRIFGARAMNALRRRAIDAGLGWIFRVRVLKRLVTVGAAVALLAVVAWVLAR